MEFGGIIVDTVSVYLILLPSTSYLSISEDLTYTKYTFVTRGNMNHTIYINFNIKIKITKF